MKRHTNKHIKILGLGLMSLAMVMGVGMFCYPTVAVEEPKAGMTKTEEVPVEFTFNSSISVSVDKQEMTISSLAAGTIEESEPVTVTVKTNSASGYYLAATVGTVEGKSADLVSSSEENTSKFTHLDSKAEEGVAMDDIGVNQWGFAFAKGASDFEAKPFIGLPLASDEQGGKKLLESDNLSGDKTVKVKVGAHAGATMMPDTYTNVINFYVVANGA